MKNLIVKNILRLACVAFVVSSCDTVDYGNVNDNPNGPTAAVTSQLLTNVQANIPTLGVDETPILYMQHITQGQYPGSSRYEVLTESYNGWYTGVMVDLNEIIKLNTDEATAGQAAAFGDNNNQLAVAKMLRSYFLQYMTDKWGALPWTDAFQGIENPKPKFDSQESLYNFMFAEVDDALSKINNGAGPDGDVLFGGDMSRWRSFGNSLKLHLAMRASDANPSLAQSKFEQAVASGSLPMTNADNIEFNYGTDDVSDSPWEDNFNTREDYIMSVTMIENLRSNFDPRLMEMAEVARDSVFPSPIWPGNVDEGYVGAPNGKVNGNVPSYSFISSDIIYEPDFPSLIYSAAQIKFALAEAAGKGWNVGSSDAATLYEEGIQANMDYWGVAADDAAAYITAHPYTGIGDIAYEKWVALFLQGGEAWAEWRRLDAPPLTPSEYASDPRIPVRHSYDPQVEINNPTNYADVVSMQGPDTNHTKLWWDKN